MREAEFLVNPHSGELVVRGADPALLTTLAAHLGSGVDLDCGECPPPVRGQGNMAVPETPGLVRVAGFIHQSMVDGPGLRSVVFFQGCARGCPQCRSSHTHDPRSGISMRLKSVMAELLRPDFLRDGITISGGEPLLQAEACAELAANLKDAGVHVAVYTGYTFEELGRSTDPATRRILALADMLVDGPYVAALHDWRSAYRGSSNQRLIDMSGTRSAGRLRLLPVG